MELDFKTKENSYEPIVVGLKEISRNRDSKKKPFTGLLRGLSSDPTMIYQPNSKNIPAIEKDIDRMNSEYSYVLSGGLSYMIVPIKEGKMDEVKKFAYERYGYNDDDDDETRKTTIGKIISVSDSGVYWSPYGNIEFEKIDGEFEYDSIQVERNKENVVFVPWKYTIKNIGTGNKTIPSLKTEIEKDNFASIHGVDSYSIKKETYERIIRKIQEKRNNMARNLYENREAVFEEELGSLRVSEKKEGSFVSFSVSKIFRDVLTKNTSPSEPVRNFLVSDAIISVGKKKIISSPTGKLHPGAKTTDKIGEVYNNAPRPFIGKVVNISQIEKPLAVKYGRNISAIPLVMYLPYTYRGFINTRNNDQKIDHIKSYPAYLKQESIGIPNCKHVFKILFDRVFFSEVSKLLNDILPQTENDKKKFVESKKGAFRELFKKIHGNIDSMNPIKSDELNLMSLTVTFPAVKKVIYNENVVVDEVPEHEDTSGIRGDIDTDSIPRNAIQKSSLASSELQKAISNIMKMSKISNDKGRSRILSFKWIRPGNILKDVTFVAEKTLKVAYFVSESSSDDGHFGIYDGNVKSDSPPSNIFSIMEETRVAENPRITPFEDEEMVHTLNLSALFNKAKKVESDEDALKNLTEPIRVFMNIFSSLCSLEYDVEIIRNTVSDNFKVSERGDNQKKRDRNEQSVSCSIISGIGDSSHHDLIANNPTLTDMVTLFSKITSDFNSLISIYTTSRGMDTSKIRSILFLNRLNSSISNSIDYEEGMYSATSTKKQYPKSVFMQKYLNQDTDNFSKFLVYYLLMATNESINDLTTSVSYSNVEWDKSIEIARTITSRNNIKTLTGTVNEIISLSIMSTKEDALVRKKRKSPTVIPSTIIKPRTPVVVTPTPVVRPPTPVVSPPTPVVRPPTPVVTPTPVVRPLTPVVKPPSKISFQQPLFDSPTDTRILIDPPQSKNSGTLKSKVIRTKLQMDKKLRRRITQQKDVNLFKDNEWSITFFPEVNIGDLPIGSIIPAIIMRAPRYEKKLISSFSFGSNIKKYSMSAVGFIVNKTGTGFTKTYPNERIIGGLERKWIENEGLTNIPLKGHFRIVAGDSMMNMEYNFLPFRYQQFTNLQSRLFYINVVDDDTDEEHPFIEVHISVKTEKGNDTFGKLASLVVAVIDDTIKFKSFVNILNNNNSDVDDDGDDDDSDDTSSSSSDIGNRLIKEYAKVKYYLNGDEEEFDIFADQIHSFNSGNLTLDELLEYTTDLLSEDSELQSSLNGLIVELNSTKK